MTCSDHEQSRDHFKLSAKIKGNGTLRRWNMSTSLFWMTPNEISVMTIHMHVDKAGKVANIPFQDSCRQVDSVKANDDKICVCV